MRSFILITLVSSAFALPIDINQGSVKTTDGPGGDLTSKAASKAFAEGVSLAGGSIGTVGAPDELKASGGSLHGAVSKRGGAGPLGGGGLDLLRNLPGNLADPSKVQGNTNLGSISNNGALGNLKRNSPVLDALNGAGSLKNSVDNASGSATDTATADKLQPVVEGTSTDKIDGIPKADSGALGRLDDLDDLVNNGAGGIKRDAPPPVIGAFSGPNGIKNPLTDAALKVADKAQSLAQGATANGVGVGARASAPQLESRQGPGVAGDVGRLIGSLGGIGSGLH